MLLLHLSNFQDSDVSIFESSVCLHDQPVSKSCIYIHPSLCQLGTEAMPQIMELEIFNSRLSYCIVKSPSKIMTVNLRPMATDKHKIVFKIPYLRFCLPHNHIHCYLIKWHSLWPTILCFLNKDSLTKQIYPVPFKGE